MNRCSMDDALQTLRGASPELESVFEGRNVGHGSARPIAFAALRPGEAVLEVASGGGP